MGHYLLDLGADASRGSRLREGWEAESDEQDASYLKLSLKHPSGFANKMVVSWTADRVDVACEMTVPETVATYPSFRPGGGWEASRDKWAFPTSSGVQTGSFSYPGGTTRAIYPADGSFQIPSEGWIALWDDKVDEVYGFTFSNGYAAAIWNGVTAEPVGQRKSAGLQGAETMAPAMPRLKPSRDARRGAKDPGCRDRLGGILRYHYRKAA